MTQSSRKAKKPFSLPHATESVEEVIESHEDTRTVKTDVTSLGTPQRFLPSRGKSRATKEGATGTVNKATLEGSWEGPDVLTQNTPPGTQDDKKKRESDQYASKMSLVAQIAQTDSHGRPLGPVPSSVKGRYQQLATDDDSLQPVPIGRKAALAATERAGEIKSDSETDEEEETTLDAAPTREPLLQRLTKQMAKPAPDAEEPSQSAKMTPEQVLAKLFGGTGKSSERQSGDASPIPGAEGGGRARSDSDGFASSVAVVSKLMKWTTKSKAVTESLEKYPGHLREVRARGRQERTQLPFPLMLLVKQEALPIIHNMAKAYKVAMGKHHKLTLEAFARYEELKNELNGTEVFL